VKRKRSTQRKQKVETPAPKAKTAVAQGSSREMTRASGGIIIVGEHIAKMWESKLTTGSRGVRRRRSANHCQSYGMGNTRITFQPCRKNLLSLRVSWVFCAFQKCLAVAHSCPAWAVYVHGVPAGRTRHSSIA
jgi:hypothetical protein